MENQRPKFEPWIYTANAKSALKSKTEEEFFNGLISRAENYRQAKEAARRWLEEDEARQLAFVQVWQRTEREGRAYLGLLDEYQIKRKPKQEEPKAEPLKKQQRKRIETEAKRISQEQGRPYAEVIKELRQKAEQENRAKRRNAEHMKAAEQWRKDNAEIIEARRRELEEINRRKREERKAQHAEKRAKRRANQAKYRKQQAKRNAEARAARLAKRKANKEQHAKEQAERRKGAA